MNLSMKWLNDYVKADMPIKEFVADMTMSGSKVETYEVIGENIKNVVVAKCVKIEKHQDSEKLWICQLDIGKEQTIQIVTAAQNVFEGAIVPAVLHGGTVIDRENHSIIKITKGKLRGVVSEGMMCSFEELGMTNDDFPYATKDGILILNDDPEVDKMKPGMDIREAVGLNDTSVEFEITNNRPDCLSVLGLAREASATFNTPFNYVEPSYKGVDGSAKDYLSVEVQNTKLCSRYMAAVVKNVKIGPSPRWMVERLRASGVRSINNLVDITNFVMLEYGHPMHAFDIRYVEDAKICVRNAKENEEITILDGTVAKLSPEMLIIADGKKPIAVAGVMGGEFSGIMEDTSTVVFESACFDGVSVRTTAKKINKRTEASSRFEKGIDPINAKPALERALQLIEILGCGEVVREWIDIDNANKQPHKLKLDSKWISSFLGIEIPEDEQITYLKRLGFGYDNGDVIVPNTRIDIKLQCDLAEEVARIYGYNRIPSTVPKLASNRIVTPAQKFEKKIVNYMLSQGCYETMTFSFISPKSYEKIRLADDKRRSVVITNPLGEDTSVMRTSMIPSMMDVIARNVNSRNMAARFYEIGREYFPQESIDELPVEKDVLSVGIYGNGEDFYSLKGIIEGLLEKCGIDAKFVPCRNDESFHTGRCAEIVCGDTVIGKLGEIHPLVTDSYGVNARVYVAEMKLEEMLNASKQEIKFTALPKYPATTRDLSLVCDDEVNSGDIIEIIKANSKHLEQVTLFDMYKGEQVPDGKKSLSYKLVLRKDGGTIIDEEADQTVSKVLSALAEKNIVLRS